MQTNTPIDLPSPSEKKGWMLIMGLILFLALFVVLGAGNLLIVPFPIGSVAVALYLYKRCPTFYVGFTLWTWFLGPFVRRLIDYQSGYVTPGPFLLTPLLVTSISSVTLLKYLPQCHKKGNLPFVLAAASVFYGFLIALVRGVSFYYHTIALFLDWLAPILFGNYLFVNWREYPRFRQSLKCNFLWGVLVMGVYGIVQFIVVPEWDKIWLMQSGFGTGGVPEPFGLNVWSTLQANRPFGTVMMAGLLLLFVNYGKGALGVPTTAVGYIAFLLARKRTTWGSWFIGLIFLFTSMRPKLQIYLLISVTVTILCVIPLTTMDVFSESITSRFETLLNLGNDTSAEARTEIYSETLNLALNSWIGNGIDGNYYHSAILSWLFNLGWLGTIPYLSGVILLFYSLFQRSMSRFDSFMAASRSIAVATFAQVPFGDPTIDTQGVILWGFLGIGMAARKYHQHQRTTPGHTEIA